MLGFGSAARLVLSKASLFESSKMAALCVAALKQRFKYSKVLLTLLSDA